MERRVTDSIGDDQATCWQLIDQMPDTALAVADHQLRFVLVSGGALEHAGWRPEEVLGRRPRDVLPAGMARLVEEHMAAALRGEATIVPVLPGTRSDVIWEGRFSPLRGETGSVTGVLFLLRDVAGHHWLGKEPQASQDLFRSTIEVFPDAFGVLSAVRDEPGQIVDLRAEYANPVACALFQRPLKKLIGQRLLEILPSLEPRGTFARLVHTVETGEPVAFRDPWFQEDVLAGAFDVRGAKLGDGIVVTLRDVTSAVRAEQQLRDSEERYRVTLDSAASGMANVGLDGRFRRVNRRFCEITGYSETEMLALTFQDITHPADVDSDLSQARQLAAGQIPWYTMEKRYIRKDGSVVWVLLTGAALRDENGQAYEYVATVTDITAQKQAQEEVSRLNADLEQRVQQRTAELQTANSNLEAFSYTVSHDLRTPLTTASGFTDLIVKDYAGQLDETCRDYLARIQRAHRRMNDLISDLLVLSRASRAEMHMTEVDLSGIAHAAAQALRRGDRSRQVRISIEDGVQARGDERLLRTVLENLLGNAWKFTSRTAGAVIEFGTVPAEDGSVHCYVRDNGAGFDPADAGKLFHPFSRLHTGEEFPGTGIGLASVRRIIERHHGHCWAEGQPGHGATFHVTLPA